MSSERALALGRTQRRLTRLVGFVALAFVLFCQGSPFHSAALRNPLVSVLALVAGLLMALSPLADQATRALRFTLSRSDRAFGLTLFSVALFIHLWVLLDIFGGIPRIDDGIGSLFQARILARFRAVLPLPPHAGFYRMFAVLGHEADLGHWCGMYPPGWPVLLMPGVWIGAPGAVAPVLGALLTLSIVALGTELFGKRTGRLAGVLALGSPFVIVLSGLHLSHIPTALFSVLCLLYLWRMRLDPHWGNGLLAGLTWGMAFLCRPLTAVVVGAAYALCIILSPGRFWRHGLAIAAAAAAMGAAAIVYILFQWAITGDPFMAGHVIGLGRRGKFGFVKLDWLRTHTVAQGAANTVLRIRALGDNVLGWPVPATVLAVLPLVLGRRRKVYGMLLLPAGALLLVYAAYWYFEGYFPARYITAVVPLLLIACARTLVLLARLARRYGGAIPRAWQAFCFGSLFFLFAVSSPDHFRGYHSAFGDVEEVLPRVVEAQGITHAIVFMDSVGLGLDPRDPGNSYYGTGFMLNDLDLKNDILYVQNSRTENVRILEDYPDRNFYLYRYMRHADTAHLYEMDLAADGTFIYRPAAPRSPLVVMPTE